MNISIEDKKNFFSHLILSSEQASKKIAGTDMCTADGKLTACVFVNGVEVSAEEVHNFLESIYKEMAKVFEQKVERREKELERKYSDLDKEADRRVRKIIKNRAKKQLKEVHKAERIINAVINQNS